MWRKTAWVLTVAAMLLLAGNVSASPISGTGDPDDWLAGTWANILTSADHANPAVWAPDPAITGITYQVGDGSLVPGAAGGQDFDVEAIYSYYYDGTPYGIGATDGLYMGIITGFDQIGEVVTGNLYTPGDVFFDFGNDGTWELAVETNGSLTGGTTGHAYGPPSTLSPWWNDPTAFTSSGPYEIDHSAAVGVSDYGAVTFSYLDGDGGTDDGGASDHNFIEVYLSESFLYWGSVNLGWDLSNVTAYMTWTMSCGNDFEDNTVQIPPGVPEPATMVMLGAIGAGMFAAKRRRHCKK